MGYDEYMRRRRRRMSTAFPMGGYVTDEWEEARLTPDDRFVRRQSICWARRVMQATRPFDEALLEWAAWALGPAAGPLACKLVKTLTPRLRDEYAEREEAPSLRASTLADCLRRLDHKRFGTAYLTLEEALASREGQLANPAPSDLERKLGHFAELFRLDPTESEMVTFLLLCETHQAVNMLFDNYMESRQFSGRRYLAALLGVPENTLPALFSGRLAKVGIIEERHNLDLESEFLKLLMAPPSEGIQTNFLQTREIPALPLAAHPAEPAMVNHLVDLLRRPPGRSATHILLYGPPGTGKTCFARSLAAAAGCRLAEVVRSEDSAGRHRRCALEVGRNLGASLDDVVLLVDEADNLLCTTTAGFGFLNFAEPRDKGWLNGFLDEPGLRAIWIVNRLEGIEGSVMRRFCCSLPFRPFSQNQRERAWQATLEAEGAAGMLSAREVRELAAQYRVSAGAAALAVRKALDLGRPKGRRFREAVVLSLEAHERLARGGGEAPPTRTEECYDPEALSVSGDLAGVTRRLKSFSAALERQRRTEFLPRVNLLLYGPPGTGKSEYARHLAEELGCPLMERRASDTLSKWLGETERNIAGAFAEAAAEGAVLVFDEADTFLRSRAEAEKSWEVSAVNEFLAQMERFRGILVCTTNRLESLDEASLRRFGEKLGFSWLTTPGKLRLFRRMLSPLLSRGEAENAEERAAERLAAIPSLAPGDFRVVRDRYALHPRGTATLKQLLDDLAQESTCRNEHSGHRVIGFSSDFFRP